MPIKPIYQNPFQDDPTSYTAGEVTPSRYNLGSTITDSQNNVYTVDEITAELMGYFNVKQYDAKGDGITDDTAAILAALAACVTSGGGIVYFPLGIYLTEGDLLTTDGCNAVIPLPYIEFDTDAKPITVMFKGAVTPPQGYGYPIGFTSPLPVKGSIIVNNTTASGTTPSIFGGPLNATGKWSTVNVIFEDLIVRQAVNSGLIGLDLRNMFWARATRTNIDVDETTSPVGQPTHTNNVGIALPGNGNGAVSIVDQCYILNQYHGILISEHAIIRKSFIQTGMNGIGVLAGNHSAHVDRCLIQECPIPINAAPDGFNSDWGESYIIVDELNIEDMDAGYWSSPVYHINDPANWLRGKINAHRVVVNTGAVTGDLTVSGATGISDNIFTF